MCPDCPKKTSSYVEKRSRIFHEDIPIPGTDMALHYASNRASGYKTRITVPASGDFMEEFVRHIVVKMTVAGITFEKRIDPPLTNRSAEFIWDGRDFLGREVFGTATAETKVGYVFPSFFMGSGYFATAFSLFGSDITEVPTRKEAIVWKDSSVKIHRMPPGDIAQGWTLTNHHEMDPGERGILYKGDGGQVKKRELR